MEGLVIRAGQSKNKGAPEDRQAHFRGHSAGDREDPVMGAL